MSTKICSKCAEEKELKDFPSKRRKDGSVYIETTCRACRKAYHKQWEQDNREYVSQKSLERYHAKNTEMLEYRAEWREKNKEVVIDSRRQYYEANKETVLERTRTWNAANRDRRNATERARRSRKLGLEGYTSPEELSFILEQQGSCCVYCGSTFSDVCKATVDHIIPITREGSSEWPANMQLLCHSCNSGKKDKTHEEYVDYLRVAFPDRYERLAA